MSFSKTIMFAGAFVAVLSASAAPITFQFTGVVTQVPIDDLSTGIAFQDIFQGSFTFDANAVDVVSSPTDGSFDSNGPAFGITVDINSFHFSRSGFLNIGVQNALTDFYTVFDQTFIGQGPDNLTFHIILQDLNGTALNSSAQPLTPPQLSAFPLRDFSLDDVDPNGNELQVDGTLTTLTLATAVEVPEPSLVWLAAGALILLLPLRSRTTPKTWIYALVIAAGVCPVYAVDGVVLISQANALAGNVTPGDTAGFPVTISVAGSYRLSGNLTVPDANTDAIDITADGVSIDLNGFSILGPVVCTGNPVTSCAPIGFGTGINSTKSNISVSAGIIRGFANGTSFSGGDNRIERVQAIGNRFTGIGSGNGQGVVSSCVSSFNGGDGIFGNGRMTGNVLEGNGDAGIVFVGVAIDNIIRKNNGDGIRGSGVISHNYIVVNGGRGIAADCAATVTENLLIVNTMGNIVPSGSGCVIQNNASQ